MKERIAAFAVKHGWVIVITFLVTLLVATCVNTADGSNADCKDAEKKIRKIQTAGLHWSSSLNADDGDGCYYTFKVDGLGMIQSATARYGDQVVYQTGQ